MTVLRLRFPLGRYHATPWDRHVNEGVPEWPPSPWRLARALYAVWRERCPELDEAAVAQVIELVASPPTYRLPAATTAATRHYYRDSLQVGTSPSKILDGFVALARGGQLDLIWPGLPDATVAATLAQLADHLSYLGRADSICEAEVFQTEAAPTGDAYQVISPEPDGDLLLPVPSRPLDLAALTVTTSELRKRRLSRPPGADWVHYPAPRPFEPAQRPRRRPPTDRVEAVVLAVRGRPSPPVELGVAVADAVSRAAQASYGRLGAPGASAVLSGHEADSERARRDQHRHAHWAPLAGPDGRVDRLVVWAPEGLPAREVAALGRLWEVRPPSRLRHGGDVTPMVRGFGPLRVTLARAGRIGEVAPELVAAPAARTWTGVTPLVLGRHPKRRHFGGRWIGALPAAFVEEEVLRELAFRGLPPARVSEAGSPGGRPAQRYRRYRNRLADAKPGVWLRLDFEEGISGPLLLGSLSHFGLGLFRPIASTSS